MIEWEARAALTDAMAASELASMAQLHRLTTQLIGCSSFESAIEVVLDATIDLQGADFGNVQLYDGRAYARNSLATRVRRRLLVDLPYRLGGRPVRLRQSIALEEGDPH